MREAAKDLGGRLGAARLMPSALDNGPRNFSWAMIARVRPQRKGPVRGVVLIASSA